MSRIPDPYRHLLLIIFEQCVAGGIYVPNLDLAKFLMGRPDIEIDVEQALKFYDGLVLKLNDRWWVPVWLKMQYREGLSADNPIQRNHYKAAERHGVNWKEHLYLLKNSIEQFEEAIEKEKTSRKRVGADSSVTKKVKKAFEKGKRKIINKSLTLNKVRPDYADNGNLLSKFITNYPIGIKKEEEAPVKASLKRLIEAGSNEEKIMNKVSDLKKMNPGMVSPAEQWLEYQIKELGG